MERKVMLASGYTLDMYCDNESSDHEHREFPHTYFSESGATCRRAAKIDGWLVNWRTERTVCPKCASSGVKLKDIKS